MKHMDSLLHDLRFAWRQMAKAPGLTLAMVACLVVGISANTVTFSITRSLLFPPSQLRDPGRLVRFFVERSDLKFGSFSYPDYKDLREQCPAFSGIAVEAPTPLHISLEGQSERFWGALVSENYFQTLGVQLVRGRPFDLEADVPPRARPVVVISNGFWQRRFAGDPQVLGRSLYLNGHPFTVIGVAAEGFTGINVGLESELWVPISTLAVTAPAQDLAARGEGWIGAVAGRLAPGVTLGAARAQVAAAMSRLQKDYPATNAGKAAALYPEASASLNPTVRGAFVAFLGLLFAIVGLVLLLACSNVAGLLMARSASRRREIAVRLALGVGRGRLVRQLLTESLVLAVIAGALGLLTSLAAMRAIQSFRPPVDLPFAILPQLDLGALAFTLVVAVATGVLFGLAPALQATRTDLVGALKQDTPGGGSGSSWFRKTLVVGQVCLTMVLLVCASMALEGFRNVHSVDLGFRPDHLLLASVDLDLQGYPKPAQRQFMRTLEQRLAALPGVTAIGLTTNIPLSLTRPQEFVRPEGFEVPKGEDLPLVSFAAVSAGYFTAMGTPLLAGRPFTAADGLGSAPVAIVNRAFVKRFWPGTDGLGKFIKGSTENLQVVGVAGNGKYFSIGEDPTPFIYLALDRHPLGNTTFLVRSAAAPASLLQAVRREVSALDPKLPVFNLRTMERQVSFSLLPFRLMAAVISAFSVLGLFLSALGIFALVSQWINQRTRDLAIRRAIGASNGQVLRIVLRQSLVLAGSGLLLGLGLGVALSRLLGGLFYGVDSARPTPYLAAAAVLLLVILLAGLLPAKRAMSLDVARALREG
jgi:putative ABC transport system permease protein